ncbi:MAG: PAS domain S-box protein [Myxococcales bacterium]|nr:PAS domain S-box protein [Myxococcales bacterium]|tara:strand:+ start:83 stop:2443 length:2361 start_codon:yes stop_codon:yes gene_type:complete
MSMNPKDELTELEGIALDGTGSDEAEALSTIFRPTEPKICIATHHRETENAVRALLEMEGWRVKAFASIEDMIPAVTKDTPNVVFLDPSLPHEGVLSVPELLHTKKPQASIRVVALLFDANSYAINEVMKDGFDDFVVDPTNQVEILARATANLRASRNLEMIHRHRRDASTLLELNQALASSLDLHLILHTVSGMVADVIKSDRCSIILVSPLGDEAVMVAASEDKSVQNLRLTLSKYPELARCVDTRTHIVIENVFEDPLLEEVKTVLEEQKIRSMALFPIIFESKVIGVLFLRSESRRDPLSEYEIQFAQTVASTCAVSLRNARLFDHFRDETNRINYMRVAAERRLEALRQFEDFFEYAGDGMTIVSEEGNILYINREGRRLFRRSFREMEDVLFADLVAPESRRTWDQIIKEAQQGIYKESYDLFISRGDNVERIFSLTAGQTGGQTGLLVFSFRDVTDTRQMEVELRTTKEFLENLIDNSPDAIVAADIRGRLILLNKTAEEVLGYESADVIGQMHVRELYPPTIAQEIMEKLRASGFGGVGRLHTVRQSLMDSSGAPIPVNMTASIIYENGEEVATVGVFTDIRGQLRMEKELSAAQSQLLATEKARVAADLAGMAAHELNQPLTSVLGYAEMLKRRITAEDTALAKPVEVVFREAERMAGIVKKIGRVTRHETKSYGAQTTMMDLERASKGAGPEEEQRTETLNEIPLGLSASGFPHAENPVIRPDTIDAKSHAKMRARTASTRTQTVSEMRTVADDFDDPQENTRPEIHTGPDSSGG